MTAFARGEVTAGPAALSAAASLVVLVVSSLLLRLGVRRWVRAQPPDPPAAVGAPSR